MSSAPLSQKEMKAAQQQLAAMRARTAAEANRKASEALNKLVSRKVEKLAVAKANKRPPPPKLVMKKVIDNEATGTAFRAYRESLGLSIQKVASQARISETMIRDLERGKSKWNDERRSMLIRAISQFTDINP